MNTMSKVEVRAIGGDAVTFSVADGKPRIDARAIVFDSWSVDLGGFRERMMPGSVTLESDLVALFDHDTSMVLGRVSAGTMEARMDASGVAFTAYPPDTTWARDLKVSMDRKDIGGCSYRMMVEEDNWYVRDGVVCRDVIRATVSELTITSMPAYPATTAEARSHAAKLAAKIPADLEERAGRVLSTDNQGRLVLARDVLDMTTELIEKATEAIDAVIATVDPTYKPDSKDSCNCGGQGCPGCDCTMDNADPNCACPDPNCPTCGTDSGSTDGSSTSARSSVGATESKKPGTFVPGFGFIPTKGE